MPTYSRDYLDHSRRQAAVTPLQAVCLRGGVTVLHNTGGNIAVASQHSSALLIDSGWKTAEPHIRRELSKISPKAPSDLINTHWHYDHTDGNAWLHAEGLAITAHRSTLSRLGAPQFNDLLNAEFPASPVGALPTNLVDEHLQMRVGEISIALRHYAPAHTDGDIRVHLEEADIVHVGDTWSNGLYPFIDSASGGHIDGLIRATVENLEFATKSMIIIPGHGPVGQREDLQRSLDLLTQARARIEAMKREGLSLEEVVAGKPVAYYDRWFKGDFVPLEVFLRCVYEGV